MVEHTGDLSAQTTETKNVDIPPVSELSAVWTSLDKVKVTGRFELTDDGEIQIGGQIKGNIKCRALNVGQNAMMEGDITAEHVHIAGRFTGKIDTHRLVLTNTATVTSDDALVREAVTIHEGADFEGSLRKQSGGDGK